MYISGKLSSVHILLKSTVVLHSNKASSPTILLSISAIINSYFGCCRIWFSCQTLTSLSSSLLLLLANSCATLSSSSLPQYIALLSSLSISSPVLSNQTSTADLKGFIPTIADTSLPPIPRSFLFLSHSSVVRFLILSNFFACILLPPDVIILNG